jgi:hypothetical protein
MEMDRYDGKLIGRNIKDKVLWEPILMANGPNFADFYGKIEHPTLKQHLSSWY